MKDITILNCTDAQFEVARAAAIDRLIEETIDGKHSEWLWDEIEATDLIARMACKMIDSNPGLVDKELQRMTERD